MNQNAKNLSPLKYTQNGVEWTFNPEKILKGPTQGNPVYRADSSHTSTLDSVVNWFGGAEEVLKLLVRNLNRDLAAASGDAFDEKSDTFSEDKWREAMAGGGSSATQSELEDELDAIKEYAYKLVTSEIAEFSPFDASNPAHLAKAQELKTKRAALQVKLDEKAESNRKRVENRKANAEAKAAGEVPAAV